MANYSLLQDALDEIQKGKDGYAFKAAGYLNSLQKFSTYFGLKVSHLIFSATEQLSLNLQAKDTTLQEAVQASKLAMQYIERQRNDSAFNLLYSHIVADCKDLTDNPALPRQRRLPQRLGTGETAHTFNSPELYFRQQYFEVLDIVGVNSRTGFNRKGGMPVAAALEKVLLDAVTTQTTLTDDSLPSVMGMYSKDINIPHLAIQLKMLPDLVRAFNENNPATAIKNVTTLRTLCDIINGMPSSKAMFTEVLTLLWLVLTIRVITATAERTFSTLRRLKTFLRSSMSQPRLNHTMLLHIHKEWTDELDLVERAKNFIAVNDRRRLYFGNF